MLLEINDIDVRYGRNHAIKAVSLNIERVAQLFKVKFEFTAIIIGNIFRPRIAAQPLSVK